MSNTFEQNFLALGKEIPPVSPSVPSGLSFVLSHQVGNMLMLSGYGPFWGADVPKEYTGKLGQEINKDGGFAAARLTGINLLLMVQDAIGSLNNVQQIIQIDGMVSCVPSFIDQSYVINGCSNLLVEIFGDQGKHIRSAVGMSSLAFDICVEITMTLLVNDNKRR